MISYPSVTRACWWYLPAAGVQSKSPNFPKRQPVNSSSVFIAEGLRGEYFSNLASLLSTFCSCDDIWVSPPCFSRSAANATPATGCLPRLRSVCQPQTFAVVHIRTFEEGALNPEKACCQSSWPQRALPNGLKTIQAQWSEGEVGSIVFVQICFLQT